MQKKKLSFRKLAMESGVSYPIVYRIKQNNPDAYYFHISTIARIADVLGVDVNDLIEREVEE
jgi:transcriptional regulator with XRE-family HTH domain